MSLCLHLTFHEIDVVKCIDSVSINPELDPTSTTPLSFLYVTQKWFEGS